MRQWYRGSRNFRGLAPLVIGHPTRRIIAVNSRHGQNLPDALAGLSVLYYEPRTRPPLWCVRFWLVRIFQTRTVPRVAKTLVAIAKTTQAKTVVATDSYSELLDAEPHLTGIDLFWVQHGLFLNQEGSSLVRERELPVRNTDVTLLSIGPYDRDNYRRWGTRNIRTIPVGSLNNGLYVRSRGTNWGHLETEFDICLVEKGLKTDPDSEYGRAFKENWDRFFTVFSAYLQQERPKLVVAVSGSAERDDVISYLRQSLSYDFVVTADDDFATYRASDAANLTIGLASTVLVESLSRQRKILTFNCTPHSIWDLPLPNAMKLGGWPKLDYEVLAERIGAVRAMTWEQYSAEMGRFLESFVVDSSMTVDRVREVISGRN